MRRMARWFLIDVVSTIPFDLLGAVEDGGSGGGSRLARVLKVSKSSFFFADIAVPDRSRSDLVAWIRCAVVSAK